MQALQNILRPFGLAFSRYRHGKGFGIHSPFAYRFITEVLRQRCHYYAYDELKDRRERLVLRLTAYFRPKTVCVSDPALRRAVRMASEKVEFVDEGADFIITDAGRLHEPKVARTICEGCTHALIVGRGAAGAMSPLLPELKHGMTFSDGKDCVVLAAYPRLPRQDFQVRF